MEVMKQAVCEVSPSDLGGAEAHALHHRHQHQLLAPAAAVVIANHHLTQMHSHHNFISLLSSYSRTDTAFSNHLTHTLIYILRDSHSYSVSTDT